MQGCYKLRRLQGSQVVFCRFCLDSRWYTFCRPFALPVASVACILTLRCATRDTSGFPEENMIKWVVQSKTTTPMI